MPLISAMYTLTELRDLDHRGMIHTIDRTPNDQEIYDRYKQEVLKKWVSLGDMILHTVFGIQYTINDTGKMYINHDMISKDVKLELTPNEFPYPIHNNMRHYVLWKLNGDITEQDIFVATENMFKKDNVIDYMYWNNPLHKRSIPGIEHVHIIAQIG
jgi:hypothetical protein